MQCLGGQLEKTTRRKSEEESGDGLDAPCADENDPHFCQVLVYPDLLFPMVLEPLREKIELEREVRLSTPLDVMFDQRVAGRLSLLKLERKGVFQRTRCDCSYSASESGRDDPECLQTSIVSTVTLREEELS